MSMWIVDVNSVVAQFSDQRQDNRHKRAIAVDNVMAEIGV